MAGSLKSKKAAAASIVDTKSVETVTSTTTTTVVTTVEESVASLQVNEESLTAVVEAAAVIEATAAVPAQRELPIFSNALLANAAISGSVTHKPKSGRVKVASGKGNVPVLKITAPTTDSEVVVMRRMDLDMVNATAMFNATYPSVSEAMEATENSYLASKYEADGAIVEKASSGALAGVWVTISQAQELAKEYGIDLFMQPLLDAPARRSTTKVASAPTPATETATVVGTISTSEPQEKDEVQTTTSETIIVATTETVFVKEEIEAIETEIVSQGTKESEEEKDGEKAEEEVEEKNEEKDEEKDEEAPVEKATVMKRRIEELEDQATRDRKRYRGLITVAVGLVAAAALPQVLPYFS